MKLVGMGTSVHAAMLGEYVIEDWAGIPSKAEDASEFRYRRPMVSEDSLAVVVTQSGETADTIMGMRQAIERGALTVAITNVVGSTAARDAHGVIYLQAGPEIGVASTKPLARHAASHYPPTTRPPPPHTPPPPDPQPGMRQPPRARRDRIQHARPNAHARWHRAAHAARNPLRPPEAEQQQHAVLARC